MAENKVALDTRGIRSALSSYTIFDAISEFVWNGFDAEATCVEVQFIFNELQGISELHIIDNGTGINKYELPLKFGPFFNSQKKNMGSDKNSSAVHGKNGIGRFTFFTFASSALWNTTYKDKQTNIRCKYSITIDSENLDKYSDEAVRETTEPCGTKVTFFNFTSTKDFSIEALKNYFSLEFAWYLELNKDRGCVLILNGEKIDYSSVLVGTETVDYTYKDSKIWYTVRYCRWNTKLHNEYSKYYYINSDGEEVYKENTTLNNKGDKFFHSVFIQSNVFDDFCYDADETQVALFGYTKTSPEFVFIKTQVDMHLRKLRNPFIREYTTRYISELKSRDVYPKFDSKNYFDIIREQSLDEIIASIYSAEPKVFSNLNLTQQKVLIRLFDMSMQSGEVDNLYSILESVIDMNSDERADLADLLKYTTMSNITKAITLIKDRLEIIQQLKLIVFDQEKFATEIHNVQPLIERNYWIFGEQYYLVTAEEPDFEEALRRYTYILSGEKLSKEDSHIDDSNNRRQMDIFAVQRRLDGKIKKCIVVELKRPTINLGSKELQQVKDYFSTIAKEDRFNADNIEWEFYLVGNDYNDQIENELINAQNHGERSLVYKIGNKKIYCKKWSDIFTDQEINLQFIKEKLEFRQRVICDSINKLSLSEATERNNSAVMPEEMKVI